MVRVHLPQDTTLFKLVYRPVDSYLTFFSIYQDWFMFAPDPTRTNLQMSAKVEFEDGTTDTYHFPNSTNLSLIDKYLYGEKFRKLMSEGIHKDSNQWMWKDAARFVLRKTRDKNLSKMPMKVILIEHKDIIPSLEQEFRPHLSRSQNYKSKSFYTYEVL